MAVSKFWLNVFGGMVALGRGLVALQLNFQIFYDNSFDTKCPGLNKK